MRLFVTDTLGNPYIEEEYLPQILMPLGESRRRADEIKRQEKITVVIGNPPYKEKAKGRGGWIEGGTRRDETDAPLQHWMPPPIWGVSTHTKHLRNLYVYFWRWATWKVFGDDEPGPDRKGVVSFITVAGFLNGPGFQKMRAELRRDADEIWVIDCSPEGHQPSVPTRIFQGVQHPVCIVMALRSTDAGSSTPARVRYRVLPTGRRDAKFAALGEIALDDQGWIECPTDFRAAFLPRVAGAWGDFAALADLFGYDGFGVMPGRTWVIAPDRSTLERRWEELQSESDPEKKDRLFHPHLKEGRPGDRHVHKLLREGLFGHEFREGPVASDTGPVVRPVRYGVRSFDRQWIIPDGRLINRPNPNLWDNHSGQQVYLTALQVHAPRAGPAVTFSAAIPDLDHYNGRGGRVFPLWADRRQRAPNLKGGLISALGDALGTAVSAPELMAYVAAVAAHPGYTARFRSDLVKPGLRLPLTADASLFGEAVAIGQEVIWLHCFGERFADPGAGRPNAPPRLPRTRRPVIPTAGAIPTDPEHFPDHIGYDAPARRLRIGDGFVDNVPAEVWAYEISGKQVLVQWFSYRRYDRSKPLIGDRRRPSPLDRIQPSGWLAEYTTELMNVLHVLGRLVALEPRQADLLQRICDGSVLSDDMLRARGSFDAVSSKRRRRVDERQGRLPDGEHD